MLIFVKHNSLPPRAAALSARVLHPLSRRARRTPLNQFLANNPVSPLFHVPTVHGANLGAVVLASCGFTSLVLACFQVREARTLLFGAVAVLLLVFRDV
ncbi:hypothetical protein DEO72_LG5g1706 [Vigna unguiculata]|uniref:Uncharacterized protein n=1 Tax=Vigna unguiculata TaxID=3917 RepID=A0A4D6LYL1_VIGUN|nr:hypothetical protein DEO72_LG5g1706 [Vigna unguiculata]